MLLLGACFSSTTETDQAETTETTETTETAPELDTEAPAAEWEAELMTQLGVRTPAEA